MAAAKDEELVRTILQSSITTRKAGELVNAGTTLFQNARSIKSFSIHLALDTSPLEMNSESTVKKRIRR
jgi:hypothetical protein